MVWNGRLQVEQVVANSGVSCCQIRHIFGLHVVHQTYFFIYQEMRTIKSWVISISGRIAFCIGIMQFW